MLGLATKADIEYLQQQIDNLALGNAQSDDGRSDGSVSDVEVPETRSTSGLVPTTGARTESAYKARKKAARQLRKEGWSNNEIAEELGITVGTVRQYFRRSR